MSSWCFSCTDDYLRGRHWCVYGRCRTYEHCCSPWVYTDARLRMVFYPRCGTAKLSVIALIVLNDIIGGPELPQILTL